MFWSYRKNPFSFESVDDIIDELSPLANIVLNKPPRLDYSQCSHKDLEPDYTLLLDHMGYEVISVDKLVELTGLTADVVSSMLLILELEGIIESQHSGKYCRCSWDEPIEDYNLWKKPF